MNYLHINSIAIQDFDLISICISIEFQKIVSLPKIESHCSSPQQGSDSISATSHERGPSTNGFVYSLVRFWK